MNANQERRLGRKVAVNFSLIVVTMTLPGYASLIPDEKLAFIVSSTSITIACLGTVVLLAWVFYFAYHGGDLDGEYEPVTRAEIIAAIKG